MGYWIDSFKKRLVAVVVVWYNPTTFADNQEVHTFVSKKMEIDLMVSVQATISLFTVCAFVLPSSA